MARSRSGLHTAVLVIVMLGTSMLTAGVMEGIRQEPARFQSTGPLDLGTFTLYSNGIPVLAVDGDDIRLLQEWAPTGQEVLSVTAGTACPAGGVTLGSHNICNGTDGPPGPPGPAGIPGPAASQRVLVTSYARAPDALCPAGGFLLVLGIDDGAGLGEPDDGELQADEIDAEHEVCHGRSVQGPPGLQGPTGATGKTGAPGNDGADGDSSVFAFRPPGAGPETGCAHGGFWLDNGLDNGDGGGVADDGILQEGETDRSHVLCNGQPGTTGPTGPPGPRGEPGAPGEKGAPGERGQVGPAGPQGDRGLTGLRGPAGHELLVQAKTLLPVHDDPASVCPTGGQHVAFGHDDGRPSGIANDTVLQEGEVDDTSIVCNGARGPTGAEGRIGPPGSPGGVDRMWIPQVMDRTLHGVVDQSGSDVGEYTSMTIGQDGLPIIAYYDRTNGDLKVAHCLDLRCSYSNRTVLDADGDVGQYASIVVLPDGLPAVAYYDASNGDLKYVRCKEVSCETFHTPAVIDQGGLAENDVGQWVMLTLSRGGAPIFDYYDATMGDLKRSFCGGITCLGGDVTFLVLDSLGDVGKYLSSKGTSVAYFDDTEDQIKYVSCSSTIAWDCTGGSVWASEVHVTHRMSWVGGNVYFRDETSGYGYTCSGCGRQLAPVGLASAAGHTSWAQSRSGEPNVFGYTVANLLDESVIALHVRNCQGTCPLLDPNRIVLSGSGNISYSAITVDPWKHPVIAYHDETDGILRFARAPNPIMSENYWVR